ncbi:hypothetical protein ACHAWF_003364 [Thalassiosira exigua]
MGWEDVEEMPTTDLREELLCLLDKELEYAADRDGTRRAHRRADAGTSSERDDAVRRNVVQWNYECADYFLIDRDVVRTSVDYFDRASDRLAADASAGRVRLDLSHLLALTSLYLACKLHGTTAAEEAPAEVKAHRRDESPPRSLDDQGHDRPSSAKAKLGLRDFCNMSRGTFCPEHLQEMELMLLQNLRWRVHPPTPADFLLRYVKMLSLSLNEDAALDGSDRAGGAADVVGKGWSVFEVSRYQVELSVYSAELCRDYLPSEVALAAVLNAADSRVVRTEQTVVSSWVRAAFLRRVRATGGRLADVDVEGEHMVRARRILKRLCSKTIVLPGQGGDEDEIAAAAASSDHEFAPIPEGTTASASSKSFEYELPEVQSNSGSSISPVSVAAADFS